MGDTMGNQFLPEMAIWPTRLLEPIGQIIKVQKTAALVTTLMGSNMEMVSPVEAHQIVQDVCDRQIPRDATEKDTMI
jgi:hypothetical protein